MAGRRRRGNPGGHLSNETGAVDTTPSAEGPGENTCGGGLYKSTNLGDGERNEFGDIGSQHQHQLLFNADPGAGEFPEIV